MLIGDKGYDSDAFRDALTKRGMPSSSGSINES
jgi:hypothetical protein